MRQRLDVLCFLQQRPPTHQWWPDANSQKSQRRFGQAHAGHRQCRDDDDVARNRWNQVLEDDARVPGARQLGGQHELRIAQCQHLAAQLPR